MNEVQKQDILEFAEGFPLWENFKGQTFLITGATGLIGSTLCHCLLKLNETHNLNLKILCPVRNQKKAESIFECNDNLNIKQQGLKEFLAECNQEVDFIIHCATPTAGKYMVSNPVETYTYMIDSTTQLLQYAHKKSINGMVYVSSLEYYGQVYKEELITEDKQGYVDPTSPRSSYPLGKRAAEFACAAYAKEYNVPVTMARLTQTFGAGISKTENRVFAQFARAAINGTDIVLKSSGKSSKPYSYTTDTASGILTMLIKGIPGEAYNVSNDETYISINDMAQMVKDNFNPNINIVHDYDPNAGYAPDTLLHLSSAKLQALGWTPKYNLVDMYRRLIAYLEA